MKKKTLVKIILVVAVVIFAVLIVGGNFFVTYAIDNKIRPSSNNVTKEITGVNGEVSDKTWMAETSSDVYMTTFDGLKLHGFFMEAADASDIYVIAMHGYKADAFHMASYARHYHSRGWNVLAPEERSHGESEGRYIGMGYFENRDVVEWAKMIVSKNANAKIILHGVSMGAATVMMATANPELPKNVLVAVEDCGYSSLTDEFSGQMKVRFKLPTFPILQMSSLIAKIRAGYFWGEVKPIAAVSRSSIPTFFVHGDADTFVPFSMLDKLYVAASCEKQKLVVSGAKHAVSIDVAPDLYWDAIDPFLDKYLK